MKTRTLTKLLSSVLCAALTMQIGWGATKKQVHADATGIITVNGNNVSLTAVNGSNDYAYFYIGAKEDGGYEITTKGAGGVEIKETVAEINILTVNYSVAVVKFKSDVTIKALNVQRARTFWIEPGIKVKINTFSSLDCGFIVQGTLETSNFDISNLDSNNSSRVALDGGTIIANTININTRTQLETNSSTKFYPTTSYTNGSNYNGKVYANRDTRIYNSGGSFDLYVGNASKTISTNCSNKKAAELFDDPFSFGSVSDVIYGTDYDFSSLITVTSGYNGTVRLEYSDNDSDYTSVKPTSIGNHYVRAVATDSGSFLGKTTSSQRYSIKYLDLADLGISSPYVSVSGVVNGKYVPNGLTIKAPDGILLGSTTIPGVEGFSDTVTLSASQILNDSGEVNPALGLVLKRSDGAMTDDISLKTLWPDIANYVFDEYDPYINVQFVDRREMSIEDGKLTGDDVSIVVADDNLDKIYLNDKLYEYDDSGEGYVEINLKSVEGKTTDYSIRATDMGGRSNSLTFTLFPNAADPKLTMSVPYTVYVGTDYDVTVKTNSDGEISYTYKYADNDTPVDSKPTIPGKYVVTVSTSETIFYHAAEDSATFHILKRTPTAEIYVPNSNIGEPYSPVVTTDSDGKDNAVIEYKPVGTEDKFYTTSKPAMVGTYTVRVTVPETDKYNAVLATSEFTIKKKIPAIVLNIGDPYVGTDFKPSVTTNTDGAAKAVIEYKTKDAPDTAYSTTVPTTLGTYIVRVTIPETATFASISSTKEFSLKYLEAPAKPFEMTGTAGKNGYFVSGVELKAPEGFTISAIYGGTYTESITYTDTLTSVYLKRTEDNALTSAIAVKKLKIDTQAPAFKTGAGNIAPGSVMYMSNINITVDDPNLKSLKVNGEPVNLSTDKDNVLSLSPGFGTKTFQITAEDEAGNVSNVEFTLKAEWLENKTIIPDVALPLEGNEYYNLDEGYWIVTRNTPEGPVQDNTVYSGNMPFYVEEGGDYTFSKVN